MVDSEDMNEKSSGLSGSNRLAHDVTDLNTKRSLDVKIERNLKFEDYMLSKEVLKGLKDAGFVTPSPIQHKAIPIGILGLDMVVQAKSGTGKTCVFVVNALQTVSVRSSETQVIILAPTREIADQIHNAVKKIGAHIDGLTSDCFIGGTVVKQDRKSCKKCHIAIGTTGRICQLVQDGDLKLEGVRLFILDEADKMMEESFQDSVNWLFSKTPASKQVIVLSATYPSKLDEFLSRYMRSPAMIKLDSSDVQLIGLKQYAISLRPKSEEQCRPDSPLESTVRNPGERKMEKLLEILSYVDYTQCLVFCNYQSRAEIVSGQLQEKGIPAMHISADLQQNQRILVMEKLRNIECRVVVSTDLTARGIDAENVNLVVNFDVPYDTETYLHRVGRAGRYGSFGAAITLFATSHDQFTFDDLVRGYGLRVKTLPSDPVPHDLCDNQELWDSAETLPTVELPTYVIKTVTPTDNATHVDTSSGPPARYTREQLAAFNTETTFPNTCELLRHFRIPYHTKDLFFERKLAHFCPFRAKGLIKKPKQSKKQKEAAAASGMGVDFGGVRKYDRNLLVSLRKRSNCLMEKESWQLARSLRISRNPKKDPECPQYAATKRSRSSSAKRDKTSPTKARKSEGEPVAEGAGTERDIGTFGETPRNVVSPDFGSSVSEGESGDGSPRKRQENGAHDSSPDAAVTSYARHVLLSLKPTGGNGDVYADILRGSLEELAIVDPETERKDSMVNGHVKVEQNGELETVDVPDETDEAVVENGVICDENTGAELTEEEQPHSPQVQSIPNSAEQIAEPAVVPEEHEANSQLSSPERSSVDSAKGKSEPMQQESVQGKCEVVLPADSSAVPGDRTSPSEDSLLSAASSSARASSSASQDLMEMLVNAQKAHHATSSRTSPVSVGETYGDVATETLKAILGIQPSGGPEPQLPRFRYKYSDYDMMSVVRSVDLTSPNPKYDGIPTEIQLHPQQASAERPPPSRPGGRRHRTSRSSRGETTPSPAEALEGEEIAFMKAEVDEMAPHMVYNHGFMVQAGWDCSVSDYQGDVVGQIPVDIRAMMPPATSISSTGNADAENHDQCQAPEEEASLPPRAPLVQPLQADENLKVTGQENVDVQKQAGGEKLVGSQLMRKLSDGIREMLLSHKADAEPLPNEGMKLEKNILEQIEKSAEQFTEQCMTGSTLEVCDALSDNLQVLDNANIGPRKVKSEAERISGKEEKPDASCDGVQSAGASEVGFAHQAEQEAGVPEETHPKGDAVASLHDQGSPESGEGGSSPMADVKSPGEAKAERHRMFARERGNEEAAMLASLPEDVIDRSHLPPRGEAVDGGAKPQGGGAKGNKKARSNKNKRQQQPQDNRYGNKWRDQNNWRTPAPQPQAPTVPLDPPLRAEYNQAIEDLLSPETAQYLKATSIFDKFQPTEPQFQKAANEVDAYLGALYDEFFLLTSLRAARKTAMADSADVEVQTSPREDLASIGVNTPQCDVAQVSTHEAQMGSPTLLMESKGAQADEELSETKRASAQTEGASCKLAKDEPGVADWGGNKHMCMDECPCNAYYNELVAYHKMLMEWYAEISQIALGSQVDPATANGRAALSSMDQRFLDFMVGEINICSPPGPK